jgi:hypothetical protein
MLRGNNVHLIMLMIACAAIVGFCVMFALFTESGTTIHERRAKRNRNQDRRAFGSARVQCVVEAEKAAKSSVRTDAVASKISEMLRSFGENLRSFGEIRAL